MPVNKKRAGAVSTPQPQKSIQPDSTKLAYSMREVSRLLGVSERSVFSLVHSGSLPHFRIGRSVRISLDAIKAYMGCQS